MAELATIGLAASIVQFLDFGSRLCYNVFSFYQSNQAQVDKVPDVRTYLQELRRILSGLTGLISESQGDVDLSPLAQACEAMGKTLHEKLSRLTGLTSSRAVGALKAAWEATWHKSDLELLQTQMEKLQAQLTLALLATIRYSSTVPA